MMRKPYSAWLRPLPVSRNTCDLYPTLGYWAVPRFCGRRHEARFCFGSYIGTVSAVAFAISKAQPKTSLMHFSSTKMAIAPIGLAMGIEGPQHNATTGHFAVNGIK